MKSAEELALAMVKSWYGRRMSGADFDEPFIKDIAKAITQERERAEKLVKALEYYANQCTEGCNPCDHLQARQALKEWRNENE
jgi:hypothetical protein